MYPDDDRPVPGDAPRDERGGMHDHGPGHLDPEHDGRPAMVSTFVIVLLVVLAVMLVVGLTLV
ncbi:hypothetical protein [Nocardioides allogilvus]|uniref:hypothetical protein n=1 Tax=Nocardioides allogilvus TaxID=2072017 RepID=UPI000D302947|nr:hypothetical protein [Nocardioides allogilvus]